MVRILLGVVLVGGAAYFGRRQSSGLSGPERTFVERVMDDSMGFTVNQFPLLELNQDDNPLVTDPGRQVQCLSIEPYLMSANKHLFEALSRGEAGSFEAKVLVAQMASAAAQPGRCPFRMPDLLLEREDEEE